MNGTQFYPRRGLKAAVRRQANSVSEKLYHVSSNYGMAHWFYLAEARYFAWLCGQPWAQQRFWVTEVAIIQRFLRATALLTLNSALDPKFIMQQALLGEVLRSRWQPRHKHFQPAQLASIVKVHGAEIFTAAYQQRRGVILTLYHAFASRFVSPWLASVGIKPQMRIERASKVASADGLTYAPAMDSMLNARQLHAAKNCLADAGVVHILQDGIHNAKGTIMLPFLQGVRPFRPSFAELALRTGAVILPVSAHLDRHGCIEITFCPALDAGGTGQPNSERIEQLLRQYASFLETEWLRVPGNITILLMKNYLSYSAKISQQQD